MSSAVSRKAPDSGTSLPRYSSNDAAMIAATVGGIDRGGGPQDKTVAHAVFLA